MSDNLTTSTLFSEDETFTTTASEASTVAVNHTSSWDSYNICGEWKSMNHLYFQLSMAFLFISYLAPNGLYGILYLRSTLLIACVFFALWGWTIICAMDVFIWSLIFVAINFFKVIVLLFYLRPVKFAKELDQVYEKVFSPLKVSRQQFKQLVDCMKVIKQVNGREVYVQEKLSKVDTLSLVLSGRFVVSQHGRALHIVGPHQFLDSPEWFGVSTDEFFQVSITAIEDARVLIWHRDKLKLSISDDQFLLAVFDHILGKDVVRKLLQVSETMAAVSTNGGGGNGYIANTKSEGEDRPLLVIKQNDGTGITALINRQMQACDPNAWRLGRIDELDNETRL